MASRLLVGAVGVALAVALLVPCARAAEGLLDWSEVERRRILSFGPWPMPWAPDRSNRVSGKPEAIDFGAHLFFDARLSTSGKVSCATCHTPEKHWTDGRDRAFGVAPIERNTPSVENARYQRWFGWAGAADSLWAQSVRPLLDVREMGPAEAHVAALTRADAQLACRYRRAFGRAPVADDETLLADIGKALAAFQETIVSARTAFDAFRDRLAAGDAAGAAAYPLAAQRGLRIFIGKGNCFMCHLGPNFTNNEFHNVGAAFVVRGGTADQGRYEGVKALNASRFSLLRRHNDDASGAAAISARHVALDPLAQGRFKVPSLRNVALTGPYMHNGQLATLEDVVRHYSTLDVERLARQHSGNPDTDGSVAPPPAPPAENILQRLDLTPVQIADLAAFLRSLAAPAAPVRPPQDGACR